jgi:hypothetical protein
MWQYSKALDFFGAHLERNIKEGCSPVGFEGKVESKPAPIRFTSSNLSCLVSMLLVNSSSWSLALKIAKLHFFFKIHT